MVSKLKRFRSKSLKKAKIYSANLYTSGVNIGSGKKWLHWFWKGFDQLDGDYINKNTVLPYNDNVINFIYSSHFIEHVSDEVAHNIFSEANRILKKGGAFRIITPDFKKIQLTIINQDKSLFDSIGWRGRDEWSDQGISYTIENLALHWFSNYQNCSYIDSETNNRPKDFYRGPPKLNKDDVYKMAKKLSTLDFGSWVISHIPKEYITNGGHISTWTHEKFSKFFEKYGFISKPKSFANSSSKAMAKFDRRHGRKDISIYHEGIKI